MREVRIQFYCNILQSLNFNDFITFMITMHENYVRYVTEEFKPYNPLDLAKKTEKLVIDGNKRKYLQSEGNESPRFYLDWAYGGVITGTSIGCNIRCIFCFAPAARDFPERFSGKFYSPEEVYKEFVRTDAKSRADLEGVRAELEGVIRKTKESEKAAELLKRLNEEQFQVRVGWCEPTIGREHLLGVLELVEKSSNFAGLMLETNGTILGSDKSYVEKISKFKKVHIRVSLKAGTSQAFRERTGAIEDAFYLPLKALEYLRDYHVSSHAAAMVEPLMSDEEKINLVSELNEIGIKKDDIEVEDVRLDPIVALRLSLAKGKRFWEKEELAKFGVKNFWQKRNLKKALKHYSELYNI